MQVSPITTLPARLATRARQVTPGVLLCVAIAFAATLIGRAAPTVGAALPAVVIGVAITLRWRPGSIFLPGITFSSKFLLQCAVALLGSQLSLASIAEVGLESLPVMLTSLTVCLVAAFWVGRAMRVEGRLRTLIGVGTGICGASAIAAVAPVVGAASAEISYAISTIFLFNILAVVVFPILGHALDLTPHAFGLFAGTAVNDTSSVVAAASIYATSALAFAVVVKLVRTLMIIPISVGLAVVTERRQSNDVPLTARRIVGMVPWFLVGFLVLAVLNTVVPFAQETAEALTAVSVFLIAIALAGVGLSTDLGAIRRAGWRPLALGGVLWLVVTATTLATMAASGWLD